MKKPLIAVLGPTASGKSGLAESLAAARDGELINADASALYRELEVGVTKPDAATRDRVTYHLLDVADLSSPLTVMDYQRLSRLAAADVTSRRKLPLLVGGSNLYARALLEGYCPPEIEVPASIREHVRSLPQQEAVDELERRDPAYWGRIDRRNPRRVTRALELVLASGQPVPEPTCKPPEEYRILRLILCPDKAVLERRIRRRTVEMWPAWLEEVATLEKKALAHWLELRKPIGYGTVAAHLRGELGQAEAIEAIVRSTVLLAKKQRTWLQKDTEGPDRHHWVLAKDEDWENLPSLALAELDGFLARFTD